MKFQVEIISKDAIKPSSPTPTHLCRHHLSFLDQKTPQIFMPLILFYPHGSAAAADLLKTSLSETLTRFYPLAGRISDNLFIDCTDDGALFVEAMAADCKLSDVLQNPDPGELKKLLPFELADANGDLLVGVQVTAFQCGGVAVSLCISHKVADAFSYFMFLNTWAAAARRNTDVIENPIFESAKLFPPGNKNSSGFQRILKDSDIVTKRFVFIAAAIADLREKFTDNSSVEHKTRRPTRVEALSAFIWRRFTAATRDFGDSDKIFVVSHLVNLRTRMVPLLSEQYFGNIYGTALSFFPAPLKSDDDQNVVSEMRNAIKKVDMEYVKKLQESSGEIDLSRESVRQAAGEKAVETFSVTSLSRFPTYEADFGWEKPLWVATACMGFKNVVVFMDTKSGDGIEAWVHLSGEVMKKFENDKELLAYTTI